MGPSCLLRGRGISFGGRIPRRLRSASLTGRTAAGQRVPGVPTGPGTPLPTPCQSPATQPQQQGRGCRHDPRLGEDREEESSRPARPEGRAQSLQARRVDGSSRQAGLQQGQGAGAQAAQGHGEVEAQSPRMQCPRFSPDLNRGRSVYNSTASTLARLDELIWPVYSFSRLRQCRLRSSRRSRFQ